MSNPLLTRSGLPPFDQIQPDHVAPAIEEILTASAELLSQAEAAPLGDWDALMEPMRKIDLLFEYGWSPVNHLLGVANGDDLRKAHEEALPGIVQFGLKVKQSKPIYERYRALRDSDTWSSMDGARKRIVEKAIQSAEQSGIALEGKQQERFNELSQQLSQLASDFSNNVLDATKAWHLDVTNKDDADGLPDSFRKMAASAWAESEENSGEADPANGPWRVKLDAPSFVPFMQHCRNRELREQAYRAYVTRASSGEQDNAAQSFTKDGGRCVRSAKNVRRATRCIPRDGQAGTQRDHEARQ